MRAVINLHVNVQVPDAVLMADRQHSGDNTHGAEMVYLHITTLVCDSDV